MSPTIHYLSYLLYLPIPKLIFKPLWDFTQEQITTIVSQSSSTASQTTFSFGSLLLNLRSQQELTNDLSTSSLQYSTYPKKLTKSQSQITFLPTLLYSIIIHFLDLVLPVITLHNVQEPLETCPIFLQTSVHRSYHTPSQFAPNPLLSMLSSLEMARQEQTTPTSSILRTLSEHDNQWSVQTINSQLSEVWEWFRQ